ncbi:hypothetical protein Poly24_00430 [Rosistilla carotiformis]|uniref:Uncharacterized protein n=1 Tax=Rosistilla carotiformis TaxID=2528017 RepID=A0A518JLE5_9BACT|nr:hypothetical protein Poly24_00430 [Rosistilla carotiformis]
MARIASHGIAVIRCVSRRGVNEERFRDVAAFASTLAEEDRLLVTDVRDVAFQRPISEVLDETLKQSQIACASEGVDYCNSTWNMENLKSNFPDRINEISDFEIYCAGVIAGKGGVLSEFCRKIWETSIHANSFNGDQIAMNVVLRTEPFTKCTNFLDVNNTSICHYGSLAHHNTDLSVRVKNGTCVASDGNPVGIVHQYTRDRSTRHSVLRKHKVLLTFYTGKLGEAVGKRLGYVPGWTPYWKL